MLSKEWSTYQTVGISESSISQRNNYSANQAQFLIKPLTTTSNDNIKIKELLAEKERQEIISTLLNNNGNISRTAKDLHISRPTLYRKMRKLNISL